MTDQARVEAHLRKFRDTLLCAACIAHEVGITPAAGRSILWTLQALPEFRMHGGKCAGCLRGKRVIRYLAGGGIVGSPARLVDFLFANGGIALCHACLAFAVEISLAEVRRVVPWLATFPEFAIEDGACAVCRTALPTVAYAARHEVEGRDTLVRG
jgi:hypothetical protein